MRYLLMKPIVLTPAAARQWTGLPAAIRARVNERLEAYAQTGRGDVKKLKGRGGSRLRVGDWRVVFFEEQGKIVVVAVGHRRDIYR